MNSVPKEHTKYFSADDITVELNSSQKDDFSILHLNMRNLNKILENLKAFLVKLGFGFQIICLTESWCSADAENENIFVLPGYTSVHQGYLSYKSLIFKLRSKLFYRKYQEKISWKVPIIGILQVTVRYLKNTLTFPTKPEQEIDQSTLLVT